MSACLAAPANAKSSRSMSEIYPPARRRHRPRLLAALAGSRTR
jgi:hypothetical protein